MITSTLLKPNTFFLPTADTSDFQKVATKIFTPPTIHPVNAMAKGVLFLGEKHFNYFFELNEKLPNHPEITTKNILDYFVGYSIPLIVLILTCISSNSEPDCLTQNLSPKFKQFVYTLLKKQKVSDTVQRFNKLHACGANNFVIESCNVFYYCETDLIPEHFSEFYQLGISSSISVFRDFFYHIEPSESDFVTRRA